MKRIRKEGYATILFLIFASILLPLGMFFFVETQHAFGAKDHMQDVIENASSAALWQLDDDELAQGNIVINESEAEQVVELLIEEGVNDGYFDDVYIISKEFIDSNSENPIHYQSVNNLTYNIDEPSYVISTSAKVKGLFMNKLNEVKNEVVAAIAWKPGDLLIPESKMASPDLLIETIKIVNPINYPNQEVFPIEGGRNLSLFAHSYVELNVESKNANSSILDGEVIFVIDDGSGLTEIKQPVLPGGGKVGLYLPENLKKGSDVTLRASITMITSDGVEDVEVVIDEYGEITGNTKEALYVKKITNN